MSDLLMFFLDLLGLFGPNYNICGINKTLVLAEHRNIGVVLWIVLFKIIQSH